MPSLKFQRQPVGLPPDVSRNTTVKGACRDRVEGASVPLPVNAAFGAVPTAPPPPPVAVIPDLTGKTDDAETVMLPPTMFEMTGVITLNVHERLTLAVSPMSVARAVADPCR